MEDYEGRQDARTSNTLELRELGGYIKPIKTYRKLLGMVGNGWEIVGVYPTYVLRSGAFLAGAFFFF